MSDRKDRSQLLGDFLLEDLRGDGALAPALSALAGYVPAWLACLVVYRAIGAMTLLPLRSKEFKVEAAGDKQVGGKPAAGLKITGPDRKDFTLYFDKESGLPVLLVAKVVGFDGNEFTQETTYADYKEFAGIKKATKIVAKRDGEKFIEEQIFNWTYTDEQRAREEFAAKRQGEWSPYGALPQMRLLTYQMPDELLAIASDGEFDEFDLNAFFEASGTGAKAQFKHKGDVQKWLDTILGGYTPRAVEHLKIGTRPPVPDSDVRLLPYLQHSFWFLPDVAACHAMANLLAEKHNTVGHEYDVVIAAGASAGIGLEALPPVRRAIGSGFETKTITLSCGKLTTGVTVPQWSSMLMLRNLRSPETYFQAAFRVQSPWSIKNPTGDNPNEEEILKPVCFVFDFAPTRALRQLSEYGIGLSPNEPNPENAVKDLVSFLPVLAYDGANMTQIDAGGILDIAMAGTSATLLARKWESALLVNVDNDTLRRILDNPEAMAAVERIEGWRALGDNIIEMNICKAVKAFKRQECGAKILLKEVPDAERFGVAEIRGDYVFGIEEKPRIPKSNYAVIGVYLYDTTVFEKIRRLKPSGRGELEITDVNNFYVQEGTLTYESLEGWWTDAGTFESLLRANNLVAKTGANKISDEASVATLAARNVSQ